MEAIVPPLQHGPYSDPQARLPPPHLISPLHDIDNWMKLNCCDAWSRDVFLQGYLSIHDVVRNQVLCEIERVDKVRHQFFSLGI
jgi:hypothetical protein